MQRLHRHVVVILTLTLTLVSPLSFAQKSAPNGLADAKTEFLRRASGQPVSWLTRGPEAFATARRTGKPLLIEVGASWCPFCLAMDRDSYSDPKVASFLNEHFVVVRIDYDAEPELAHKLELLQARANLPSGMPLIMLVTPDGKLFDGGAYFPPMPAKYKPSFTGFLRRGADEFNSKRFPVETVDVGAELQTLR